MNDLWWPGMIVLGLLGAGVYLAWTWRKQADKRRQERRDERRAEPKG